MLNSMRSALLLAIGLATFIHSPVAGQDPPVAAAPSLGPAPMGDHLPPQAFPLLRLAGDATEVRYTPGSLDRAANVQTRLEVTARTYRKWVKVDIDPVVFVLSRRGWQEAGYPEAFGLPVRVGDHGLAVPALGDPETIALWSELLDGKLPVVEGFLFRGTPQEAATMVLADVLVQRAAGELLIDGLGIEFEEAWVRELAVHIATQAAVARIEPGRVPALDALYHSMSSLHTRGTQSARDFGPGLELADWLWFQAQFHRGARRVLGEADAKDAVRALRGLAKKSGGRLTIEQLLRKWKGLQDWLHGTFTTVSMRARR
jgi:hypothetical protein